VPSHVYIQPTYHANSNAYANNGHHHYYSQQQSSMNNNSSVINETVHLYVPNTVIGAIIGTKGVFIKSIIKHSNATVKVAPISPDEDQNKIIDRQVSITGTPEAQWKAQYYIYDKIRQEGNRIVFFLARFLFFFLLLFVIDVF